MKWLVNLESARECDGGRNFAQWLAHTSKEHGVAMEMHALRSSGSDAHGMTHLQAIHLAASNETEAEHGSTGEARTSHEIEHLHQAMQHAALEGPTSGLIVPRAAARDGFHLVRLGALARRIHASSAVPFVIVPPDLKPQDIGEGPIVAATDLGAASVPACEMAMRIARATARPLTVVYVAQIGEFLVGPSVEEWPPPRLLSEDNPTHPFQRLRRWVHDHRIAADALDLLVGHSGEALVEYAGLEFSPLIVAGRRRVGPVEKILRRSTSAYLCGHAHCATLVVPTLLEASVEAEVLRAA